jgi:sugar (pentulose or hexulose) kinase
MNPNYYIACDLGAESGRVMLGRLEDGRLQLEELHRFPSAAVRVLGSLRWDVLRIFEDLKTGLRVAAQRHSNFQFERGRLGRRLRPGQLRSPHALASLSLSRFSN